MKIRLLAQIEVDIDDGFLSDCWNESGVDPGDLERQRADAEEVAQDSLKDDLKHASNRITKYTLNGAIVEEPNKLGGGQ